MFCACSQFSTRQNASQAWSIWGIGFCLHEGYTTSVDRFHPKHLFTISGIVPSCHSQASVLTIEHATLTLILAALPREQPLQAIFECFACCRHAVRLWRQMLQSLKEALLSNCPAVVAQDVLGRALLEGLQSVNLRYSQLQPSEQWQARLTADKWHITETCQLLSQPSGGVYRCVAYQDRTQDLHVTTGTMSSLPCASLHL